ncbi:MAG: 5'/3'-nucleotidase SurE [Clostridia bacterium]
MPNFLVTNDDGIQSPSLVQLAHTLRNLPDARVFVVAPEGEWSASGHGITVGKPLYANAVRGNRFQVPAWSVSGSPADCVKLALNHLIDCRVDMVFSGINLGYNLATDVLYSGTVAAAIEAVLAGVPALAISGGRRDQNPESYALEARVAAGMTEIAAHLPRSPWLLNVNVPKLPAEDIEGVAFTELGPSPHRDRVLVDEDGDGRRCYHLSVDRTSDVGADGTDLAAIRCGRISITPLEILRITESDLLRRLLSLNGQVESIMSQKIRI